MPELQMRGQLIRVQDIYIEVLIFSAYVVPAPIVDVRRAEENYVVELPPERTQKLIYDEFGLSAARWPHYEGIAWDMIWVHIYGRPEDVGKTAGRKQKAEGSDKTTEDS